MKYSSLVALLLIPVLFGAGCSSAAPAATSSVPANNPTAAAANQTYALDEVAKHATQNDCWTAINGKVYDVTKAIDSHPGGTDKILMGCGKDATTIFNDIKGGQGHPPRANENLGNYLIGTLK